MIRALTFPFRLIYFLGVVAFVSGWALWTDRKMLMVREERGS